MSRRTLIIAAALLVALVWFLWPRHDESPIGPAGPGRLEFPAPTTAASQTRNPKSQTLSPLEVSTLAAALNSPTTDIRADLRVLQTCLENFRTNFPRDGNPVGSNAEITATLTGQNKLRYAVIAPNHPAINRAGELCDRWGTPFFFHAESGTRMTVLSAGPDKKFHTDDDIELSP